jgi:beta-lactamase regulating signal transducer with metallopeptidase domain
VTTQPAVSFVIDTVFMPAVISAAAPHSSSPSVSILPWVLVAVWTAGVVAVLASWWQQWIPVRAALRDGRTLQLGPPYDTRGLAVRSSPSMFGPAVVGIRRPVLLLPADLIDRLTPAQVNALMAHERSHVSCHDNLAAAVHMAVEAIFWFHPIVWWIESRLIDERERACDEVVLQSGSRPRDYAEGILEVCRRSVASPLACVTGVGGSNLRYRIESIMREEIGRPLTTGRRCALACAVVTAVGAPVAGGMMQAQGARCCAARGSVGASSCPAAVRRVDVRGRLGHQPERADPRLRFRASVRGGFDSAQPAGADHAPGLGDATARRAMDHIAG